jgi:DNA-binding transcriptional ArsR family regulator
VPLAGSHVRGPLVNYYLRMDADRQVCRRPLPDDQVDLVVEGFRLLADGTGVRILWALLGRELPVNELAAEVGKPASSVSRALSRLRWSRMVTTRREGNQIFYALASDHLGQMVLDAVHNAEHAGPGVPSHHLTDADLAGLHPDPAGTRPPQPIEEPHR